MFVSMWHLVLFLLGFAFRYMLYVVLYKFVVLNCYSLSFIYLMFFGDRNGSVPEGREASSIGTHGWQWDLDYESGQDAKLYVSEFWWGFVSVSNHLYFVKYVYCLIIKFVYWCVQSNFIPRLGIVSSQRSFVPIFVFIAFPWSIQWK